MAEFNSQGINVAQHSVLIKPIKEISFYRSTANQIYEFVRDSIVSMEFEPGQLISETGLAQQFGVSRTPVRGALVRLSSAGFVEIFPQRGTYVTKLSMTKIYEAQFIREALEVAVIRKLTLCDDEFRHKVADECSHILDAQRIAAAQDNFMLFQKLDDKFHQTLAIFTHHLHTAELIESEKSHLDRVRRLSLHQQGQYHRILNQHSAIIKAIRSGSPDKAATAMSMHLQDVLSILELIPTQHPEYFSRA